MELTDARGKEQSAIWHSLVTRTNRRQAETSEKIAQKQLANSDPDMSVAPPWMREVLAVANDLIAQGAGELTDKGEFADVEYKVRLATLRRHRLAADSGRWIRCMPHPILPGNILSQRHGSSTAYFRLFPPTLHQQAVRHQPQLQGPRATE